MIRKVLRQSSSLSNRSGERHESQGLGAVHGSDRRECASDASRVRNEAAARAAYDNALRAEWDSGMDANDDGPYPGNPDEAQDRMRQAHGAEWSRWELTSHDVEIPETN